jgi:hypothetical protein
MKSKINIWLTVASLVALTFTFAIMGCETEPSDSVDNNVPSQLGVFERCENYPAFDLDMAYNEVVPPIGWSGAYLNDGRQEPFSLEAFFCGEAYEDKRSLVLVIGAGWCHACARLIQNYINPVARQLTSDMDAELVYLDIQDTQYMAANSDFAYRHLGRLIDEGPGWRVGDLDTMIRDGDEMEPTPGFITRQTNLPVLPAVWVIRKRDMRIIATRELAWQARPGELPLSLIAMDPEQEWSDPPLPPFQSQCQQGDEEETEDTTNNVVENATVIDIGVHSGGICDSEPDFYSFDIQSPWQLSLTHDTGVGDLDLMMWDQSNNLAALDEDGRIIGSFTADNIETLTGEGPAFVQIRGYSGSSAPYTLTLKPR